MMKRLLAVLLFAALALHAAAAETPRLIVVISIDQFRGDYLERFQPWFGPGGFNRFLKAGAVYRNANYIHANTFTGPGHASIGTGQTPSESGIVGNSWFETSVAADEAAWDMYFDDMAGYDAPNTSARRPAGLVPWYRLNSGTPFYCVSDSRVKPTAGKTWGVSPVRLSGDSLADRVKEHDRDARVVSVALKDRAAILMGGRKADAAYWFDPKLPGFISSTYYRSVNPALFRFNERVTSYIPASKEWMPSGFIPEDGLQRVTFDPPAAWPMKTSRYNTTFPHPIKDVRALTYTPFANDLVLDFASSAIDAEKLGADDHTDILYVGLSTPDYLGHYYGPDSREVADDAVRIDRSLAKFLDRLDTRFKGRVLVALTADHGVQSTPEIAKLRDPRLDAGRVDLRNPKRDAWLISQLPPLRIELEARIAKKLGTPWDPAATLDQEFVYFFEEPSLHLNWRRINSLGLDGEQVKRAVRDSINELRDKGFDRAFTNSELMVPNDSPPALERAVRASFRADRSGDVVVALRQNWIWKYSSTNTTHGQPLPDDQHVPLAFWGTGVKKGVYDDAVAPTDLARTLGAVIGVEAGGSQSRVLPAVETRPTAADYDTVIALVLAKEDPDRKQTIVAGERLTGEALASAGRGRALVRDAAIAKTLPAGTLRLDSVSIDGNTARVQVWRGPIPQPQPGRLLLDCGTGTTYALERAGSTWTVAPVIGRAVC